MRFEYTTKEIEIIEEAINKDVSEVMESGLIRLPLEDGSISEIPCSIDEIEHYAVNITNNAISTIKEEHYEGTPQQETAAERIKLYLSPEYREEIKKLIVLSRIEQFETGYPSPQKEEKTALYDYMASRGARARFELQRFAESQKPVATHGVRAGAATHFQECIEDFNKQEIEELAESTNNNIVQLCDCLKTKCETALKYSAAGRYARRLVEFNYDEVIKHSSEAIDAALTLRDVNSLFYLPSIRFYPPDSAGISDSFIKEFGLEDYPPELLMDLGQAREYLEQHVAYYFIEWAKTNAPENIKKLNKVITDVLAKCPYIKHGSHRRKSPKSMAVDVPQNMPNITMKELENALTFRTHETDESGISLFEGGGVENFPTDESTGQIIIDYLNKNNIKVLDRDTKEEINIKDSKILPPLCACFLNLALTNPEKFNCMKPNDPLTIYVKDIARRIGKNQYREEKRILDYFQSASGKYLGFIPNPRGYKPNIYGVLLFSQYSPETGELQVSSPYFYTISKKLIENKKEVGYGRNKREIIQTTYYEAETGTGNSGKKSGSPTQLCVEWVTNELQKIITETGKNGIPNIKPTTLLKKCPYFELLSNEYENHPSRLLKSIFKNVFKNLIRNKYVADKYILPDLNNEEDIKKWIPTAKTLDGMTYHFYRKDKKQKDEPAAKPKAKRGRPRKQQDDTTTEPD